MVRMPSSTRTQHDVTLEREASTWTRTAGAGAGANVCMYVKSMWSVEGQFRPPRILALLGSE